MKILVTGGSGWVGGALVHQWSAQRNLQLVAAVRRGLTTWPQGVDVVQVEDLSSHADWSMALQDTDAVVHCAARVHIMKDPSANPLEEFRRVNVQGTANLARQAAVAGVRRLVFVSSVKVNGEQTAQGSTFTADDVCAPEDPYGISKHEAEQALRQIAAETGMEVVIIRPPLVYGPGVKANFAAMVRWLARGVPLPLGAVTHNRRSLVALDNLVDLITLCLTHPAAANQTFMVSDGEDLSTADMLRRMGNALGRPARLLPVPVGVLRLGAQLVGKPDVFQRLCGSLQVDIAKTRELLGWQPPVSVDEGFRRVAQGFRA